MFDAEIVVSHFIFIFRTNAIMKNMTIIREIHLTFSIPFAILLSQKIYKSNTADCVLLYVALVKGQNKKTTWEMPVWIDVEEGGCGRGLTVLACRGWNVLCSSQISCFISSMKSGMNTENYWFVLIPVVVVVVQLGTHTHLTGLDQLVQQSELLRLCVDSTKALLTYTRLAIFPVASRFHTTDAAC